MGFNEGYPVLIDSNTGDVIELPESERMEGEEYITVKLLNDGVLVRSDPEDGAVNFAAYSLEGKLVRDGVISIDDAPRGWIDDDAGYNATYYGELTVQKYLDFLDHLRDVAPPDSEHLFWYEPTVCIKFDEEAQTIGGKDVKVSWAWSVDHGKSMAVDTEGGLEVYEVKGSHLGGSYLAPRTKLIA